ncbi:MAG TPA: wax ester/triacylglycerol synthase family O-acyltransferase [Acidimicrobiales bacterium]|nr:wax ester/triacylglycerol synthase family O-acyltransferase [Acidimicrobiales bacterium]
MDQLGGLDGAFVYAETPATHLHVCGLLLFDTATMEGGYSFDRIRAVVEERLLTIPVVRQKLATVPLHLSRPFWVDDPDLDVDRHVHRVDAPPPGDDFALADLVGEIASRPLPRDRPLWEVWVIEGLADDRLAVVVKMHHSTIDGVTGANLMGNLFDLDPAGTQPAVDMGVEGGGDQARTPAPATAGGTGSSVIGRLRASEPVRSMELLGRGVASRLAQPWEIARLLPMTTYRIASTVWSLGRRGEGVTPPVAPFTAPRTSFNATITGRRSVAFTSVSLADIKKVKNVFGVTVNDVVTAVVGGALRHYLDDRGELPERSLIAVTPISVHGQTGPDGGTTRLSVMFSTLASDVADPAARLETVAAANDQAKDIHRMVGADTLMRWAGLFWPNAFALGARLYSDLHVADHHPVVHNLILSNVPGPPVPLYFGGARLVGLFPLGPIMDGAGLNVTVLSEEDRVGFGLIACPDLVPRVWDVAAAIPVALDELLAVVPTTPAAIPAPPGPPVP